MAVITLANVLKPDSFGFNGREVLWSAERRRFVASPRANAGKAKDCVNVSLCNDSLNEYGPTDPRAAARNSAYSRSSASNNEYLAVIVDDLRRLWSIRSVCSQGSESLKWNSNLIRTHCFPYTLHTFAELYLPLLLMSSRKWYSN